MTGLPATRELFDDDHEAFRETVRKFVAAEVQPHLSTWRTAGQVPREFFLKAGAHGLLGTAVPEELGGGGTEDQRFLAVVIEELAAVGAAGLALTLAVHCGVCLPLVLARADDAQRKAWVPELVSGELLATTAAMRTPSEVRVVADGIRVDAAVDGVPGGAYPGLVVIPVATDGGEGTLIVPPLTPVVSRRPVADPLGARDAGLADLELHGTVPGACLLDSSLEGVRRDLDLWSAVLGTSLASAVVRLTIAYVRERKVFGRPLSEMQNTRHRLAALTVELSSAQSYVDDCLRRRGEAQLTPERATTARLFAQTVHDQAVDQGMQLHGGYGYMLEYPISHAFADARALRIAGRSTSDALDLIAADLGI